jgi:hypothetical protein
VPRQSIVGREQLDQYLLERNDLARLHVHVLTPVERAARVEEEHHVQVELLEGEWIEDDLYELVPFPTDEGMGGIPLRPVEVRRIHGICGRIECQLDAHQVVLRHARLERPEARVDEATENRPGHQEPDRDHRRQRCGDLLLERHATPPRGQFYDFARLRLAARPSGLRSLTARRDC